MIVACSTHHATLARGFAVAAGLVRMIKTYSMMIENILNDKVTLLLIISNVVFAILLFFKSALNNIVKDWWTNNQRKKEEHEKRLVGLRSKIEKLRVQYTYLLGYYAWHKVESDENVKMQLKSCMEETSKTVNPIMDTISEEEIYYPKEIRLSVKEFRTEVHTSVLEIFDGQISKESLLQILKGIDSRTQNILNVLERKLVKN